MILAKWPLIGGVMFLIAASLFGWPAQAECLNVSSQLKYMAEHAKRLKITTKIWFHADDHPKRPYTIVQMMGAVPVFSVRFFGPDRCISTASRLGYEVEYTKPNEFVMKLIAEGSLEFEYPEEQSSSY